MQNKLVLIIVGLGILTTVVSFEARATPCGEFIYNKNGWLRKYKWLPNTATENTKKNGIASSTIQPSIEQTTASVDPGVSTGATISETQSMSSYGPCSFMKIMTGKAELRREYIKENLEDIKKQAAVGRGGHLESLALMSRCSPMSSQRMAVLMQKDLSRIYDFAPSRAADFATYIDSLIDSDRELGLQCSKI
jgi:hypothetical protein